MIDTKQAPIQMVVNGVTYVRATPCESPIKIVVLQRGWVAVGHYECDGDQCSLKNASIIRIWGTTRGLGELVSGPTPKTILDPAGTIRFHALAVVLAIDAEETSWASAL